MAGDEDTDERAARLLARSEGMREKTIRRRQALEWAQRQTAAVVGTAASTDGMIRATVDETGVLARLELSPRAQEVPSGTLARAITTVVQQAVKNASNQIRETYEGLRNEGVIKELPSNLLPAPAVDSEPVTVAPSSAQPAEDEGRATRPATRSTDTVRDTAVGDTAAPSKASAGTDEEQRILRPATESTWEPWPDASAGENISEEERAQRDKADDGGPSGPFLRRATW